MRFRELDAALLVGLASAVVRASGLAAQAPNGRLESGRAGQFEVGQPVDDIMGLAGQQHVRLVNLDLEGQFTPAIEIRLADAQSTPSLVAQIREWPCPGFQVWNLMVYDRRFRTVDGIGVGTTLRELRRRYPRLKLGGEGGPSATVDSLHMTFVLSSGTFADGVQVTRILLWPDPNGVRARRCPTRDSSRELMSRNEGQR